MKEFYSNCIVEALREKLKNPSQIKLKFVPSHFGINVLPHWMWNDGKNTYDFYFPGKLKWYQQFWYKGYIRKTDCDYYDRCMVYVKRKKEKNRRRRARKRMICRVASNIRRCSPLVITGKARTVFLKGLCDRLSSKGKIKNHEILSAENVHTSLIQAFADKRVAQWRNSMLERDAVIIEQFEYFAGKRCAQEELLSVLKKVKSPIVISSAVLIDADNGFINELADFFSKGTILK